jgi:hypothetical protein
LAKEKNAGFVVKRGASRSGGKRVRPTKDKKLLPALTIKKRKKKRGIIAVVEASAYRVYTAFDLYSAIMYFTSNECERSKMKLEQKFPKVPYTTVLDYVNKPEKMKNIDLLANSISNGAKTKLPKAFERVLYCFVHLSEVQATPFSMSFINTLVRDGLIKFGATYRSKNGSIKRYDKDSNVADVWRGIHGRMNQDGFTTKVRGGKPCSLDRVKAESVDDARHIKEFEDRMMWRITELGEVIYTESNGEKMISLDHMANWDESQLPLCSQTGDQNFLVTSNKKIQNITSSEKAPTVTMVTVQIGTTPITPCLLIVAEPKLKEGEVNTFVEGCNPEDSAFRVFSTHNGWMNDAAKIAYLRILIESDQNNFGKEKIIFMYDGHFTNHNHELLKLCWAHDLFPMVIPPHLTHLMNPMDMRKGVISGLKKRISSTISSHMRVNMTQSGGQNIERIPRTAFARLATSAFKEYVNDPKTKSDLACALRSCGFFEQDRVTALENCKSGKEMVPTQLIYAVTQSALVKHLFEDPTTGSKKSTNKKQNTYSDVNPLYAKMACEVIGRNLRIEKPVERGQRSVGGSDYTNSSTADAENARRRANNALFKAKERERIDSNKSRAVPERNAAKAAKDLEKVKKKLVKLEEKETALEKFHESIADAEIPKGYLLSHGVRQLPDQPMATAGEETRHAFAAERIVPTQFLKEYFGDEDGNVSRHDQQKMEQIEKATVTFAREKNIIKTKAQLELLAELLNIALPKDKKEAENLLFGENAPKRWSIESLNQWKANVLKPAREEVEEKEADLETTTRVLTNAPAAVEHDITFQPLLRGGEYEEYDSRDFMRTAAVRVEAYNYREARMVEFGERLNFGIHDQSLAPEERTKRFADAILNQARSARILPNNENENENENENRREPARALDASPVHLHPYSFLATSKDVLDERYQRTMESDLLCMNYDSNDDDDFEFQPQMIAEYTDVPDTLLEEVEEFPDDWNAPGDYDNDW